MKKRGSKVKKILKGTAITAGASLATLISAVLILFRHEIGTVLSVRSLCGPDGDTGYGSFLIRVSGDYYFDDFLEAGGASDIRKMKDFLMKKFTKGLLELPVRVPKAACSAFTAPLENGDRIMGRNYDYHPAGTAVVFTEGKKGKHASVSTVDLAFLGIGSKSDSLSLKEKFLCLAAPYAPVDGMNDAGLSAGILVSGQFGSTDQCTEKPDLLCVTMLRLILDYADDVDEAVELIRNYDIHDAEGKSFHYMVADRSGRSVVIEYVCPGGTYGLDINVKERELRVIEGDPTGTQTVSNYILVPDFYTNRSLMHGKDNVEIMEKALLDSGYRLGSEQVAMDILESVSKKAMGKENGSSKTLHSVVYNLTERTAYWVMNEHYGEEKYTFRFELK